MFALYTFTRKADTFRYIERITLANLSIRLRVLYRPMVGSLTLINDVERTR